MKSYDVAVIGAGPGGYVAAKEAAKLGLKTACIEKHSSPGGTCLHVGCIPSKTLLYATELYSTLKTQGDTLGITSSELGYNFEQMMKNKASVIATLAGGVSTLLKGYGVDLLHGEAAFSSPNTLTIGKETLTAKNFILATGSKPIALPFLPFDKKSVIFSTEALSLSQPPKKMTIIGAGVIGVEIASIYRRLGTEVTMVEALDHICTGIDRSICKELLKILKKQGITFHLSTLVSEADGKTLTLSSGETLTSELTLVAIGRRPNTASLNLEELNIETTAQGFIPVDDNFRTSLPHIYAIGDLTEGPMLAHRASEDGIAVASLIAGKTAKVNYATVPNVIYTHPEVATVGLTEEEVSPIATLTGTSHFRASGRAHATFDTEGFVKVVAAADTRRLIGLHIISPHASEMITEGVVAINAGITVDELANASHPHPTLSETIKEAALSVR